MTLSDDMPVFCQRLRLARQAAGLSQKQLGMQAGLDAFVASTRINRYEQGVHQPDNGIVRRLATVLDVPVAYFFADDEGLAALILAFHRASRARRKRMLQAAAE